MKLIFALLAFTLSACAHQASRLPASDERSAGAANLPPTRYKCSVMDQTHQKSCGSAIVSDAALTPEKNISQFLCNTNTFGDNKVFLMLSKPPVESDVTTIAFGTGEYNSFGDATTFEAPRMNIPDTFRISLNSIHSATLQNIKQVYTASCAKVR